MIHLVQRHWAVDVYQVFFWFSIWASFLVLGHPATHCESWGWAGHSQSWEKDQLSSFFLALKVRAHSLSSDNWGLTEVFWTSSDRYTERYQFIRCAVTTLYSMSVKCIECHREGYRGDCVQEQWVSNGWVGWRSSRCTTTQLQLHSYNLLLPPSLGFLLVFLVDSMSYQLSLP